jgi:hypothetical protein
MNVQRNGHLQAQEERDPRTVPVTAISNGRSTAPAVARLDLPDGRRLATAEHGGRRQRHPRVISCEGPAHHPRAVIVPCVINSELVKSKATEKDPWGLEYTKLNTAGSGAYKVTTWNAGSEVILERNDNWKGGPLPKVRRVIWRMVPSAGNRRALLERGDADISYDLPNKDFVELREAGKLNIVSTPYSNGIHTSA